jgi:hypothetical protein
MSKIDVRTASERERAADTPVQVVGAGNEVPRWESWMTTMGGACALMLVAGWLPRHIAKPVVLVGGVLATIGVVQMLIVMRRT